MQAIGFEKDRMGFQVLAESTAVQAVQMTLDVGEASSEKPENEHSHSEQWLFVVQGSGELVLDSRGESRSVPLPANSLVLIAKGELHQVRNTGGAPLVTLNFYAPPAYGADGMPR
jgi:mannose-6-phosphate isomerase-like protein (cupin superfamily)